MSLTYFDLAYLQDPMHPKMQIMLLLQHFKFKCGNFLKICYAYDTAILNPSIKRITENVESM